MGERFTANTALRFYPKKRLIKIKQRITTIKQGTKKERIVVINIYKCTLCGRERHVRTYPKAPCWCRVKFPNKHMYFKCQIRDFFIWLWQQIHIFLLQGEWT